MKMVMFEVGAFRDFTEWATTDKKIFKRIADLIRDILRDPFVGIGKPEPLKYELQGCWSRRINDEHRLVYKVNEQCIIIVSCKYHYN